MIIMYGVTGKILNINLTDQSVKVESLSEEIYRKYLGGYGLGAYYIYNNIKPGCDPLGPDNILGFIPGLLTGSVAPMTGRFIVCGKSPLTGKGKRTNGEECTGGWGNANSGGTFGPAIRKAGFDGIFITGVALNPTYLLIEKDSITLESAASLWGKDCVETEEILKERHGKSVKVSSIGRAGENKSLIAGIVNDKGRIAARSGLGAVMGSKNLKALCLKGNTKVDFAAKPQMLELSKAYNKKIKSQLKSKMIRGMIPMFDVMTPLIRVLKMPIGGDGPLMSRIVSNGFGGAAMGTTMVNVLSSQNGDSPVKNYKGVGYKDFPWKSAMNFRGKTLKSKMKRQYGCFSCPVRCGAILEHDELPYDDKETHRPEYETCAAFGSLILNDDLDVLMQANEYLNRTGMDTISAGNIVAYVHECVENQIFTKDDFKCNAYPDGFLPSWGESQFILPLLKMIVNREGLGDKLADGLYMIKQHFPQTAAYAITSNGQELPMHDLRLDPGLGLTYLTDPTPGRHTAGTIDFEGGMGLNYFLKEVEFKNSKDPYQKGFHSADVVKVHQLIETLGFCIFGNNFGRYPFVEMIEAAFGWKFTAEEILTTGQRIQTLRQMFNAREGAIRHELNQRTLGNPPLEKGPLKKISVDLEIMAQGYYEGMGFETNGVPKKSTLEKLGLEALVSDLEHCTGAPEALVNKYLSSGDKSVKSSPDVTPLRGG
ncbi:aldehyde ferredoxin oxidoreductase family protein [Candidatus Lokiarchaeum ossiferum]|uniref:aldehyde ferredoxin oxidoreductase family protein n=1 Tax=Candidatus Lokiarchaeum ossiferum TaxID=2951803 RepID=UPI00352D07C6